MQELKLRIRHILIANFEPTDSVLLVSSRLRKNSLPYRVFIFSTEIPARSDHTIYFS